jgi:putative transcriptional regulator
MNLTGKLLIAPPNVRGNFWQKTVIYVTENHARGSMGIVINKRSKMPIREFAQQCGVTCDLDGLVYVGGPVNVKALSIIHSSEWSCTNTMHINNEFSISSSPDLLLRLASGDKPYRWRLALGLCAWAPDQLENEIKGVEPYSHNFSWLLATPSHHSVFESDGSEQWTNSIEQSGLEFVQSILD